MTTATKLHVHRVNKDEVFSYRHAIETYVGGQMPAIMESYHMGDISDKLCTGEMQLWVAEDAEGDVFMVLLTQLAKYPKGKVCFLLGVAGKDMAGWLDELMELLKTWSLEQGCSKIIAQGRDGWERALKPHGYEKTHTVVQCYLKGNGNV